MDPLLQALRTRYDDSEIGEALLDTATHNERQKALERWETGVARPGLDALRQLASELGRDIIIGAHADTIRDPAT